jgi:hypothetical protein
MVNGRSTKREWSNLRNPDRIDVILEQFRQEWKKYPDLRFTQLVANMTGLQNSEFYYIEDDSFQWLMDKYKEDRENRSGN